MKMKRLLCLLLLLCLLCSCGIQPTAFEQSVQGCKELLGVRGELLAQRESLPAGSSLSDWLAIALCLGGAEEGQRAYLQDLTAYVEGKYQQQGTLDTYKATEFHRIALTIKALGGEPTDVGSGHIDLIADGVTDYAGNLSDQGLNGPIFALLTLDCGGYGSDVQRKTLVSDILAAQEEDGSFGLVPGSGSVDITAMALQALAPYESQWPSEIENALGWLSDQLSPRCTFTDYGSESAESVSQVIIALCALDIDPRTDARFRRGESTLVTALETFRTENGTYRHSHEDAEESLMATEQAMLALIALERLQQGKSLYNFR